jgi:prolyl-tRNA synthetase
MGVIVEKYADDKGLVWPENLAPYKYYIIGIGEEGEKIAAELEAKNRDDIILDNRDMRPGQKFADAELMGIPYRVVISEKTLKENSAEITNRKTGEAKMISIDELRKEIK